LNALIVQVEIREKRFQVDNSGTVATGDVIQVAEKQILSLVDGSSAPVVNAPRIYN